MSSRFEIAVRVREIVNEGTAWIALYRRGKGWFYEVLYLDYYDSNKRFYLDRESWFRMVDIMSIDPEAVICNPNYTNMGSDGTIQSLCDGLKYAYNKSGYLISVVLNMSYRAF